MEFVELNGGLMAKPEDIALMVGLEHRGMSFQVDGETLRVKGPGNAKPELTPEEIAHIKARKVHLMALVTYEAPEVP